MFLYSLTVVRFLTILIVKTILILIVKTTEIDFFYIKQNLFIFFHGLENFLKQRKFQFSKEWSPYRGGGLGDTKQSFVGGG